MLNKDIRATPTVGLLDALCTNTGHFGNSSRSNLCCVVVCKRHRKKRETISIVKPQLIKFAVYWLAHDISVCVCDVTITPRIASTAANKPR